MQRLTWYVSYGSNMYRARLMCYLQGGRPPGARRTYTGARDHTPPRADAAVDLPGRIYFAGDSPVWTGGVAFYDPDHQSPAGRTPARAFLLTVGQFVDVAAQEMHRDPRDDDPLERLLDQGLDTSRPDGRVDPLGPSGRYEAGPGAYETILTVGWRGGTPMLTFTAGHSSRAVPHTAPSPAYLQMLAGGLRESHGMTDPQIERYLTAVSDGSAAPHSSFG